MGILSAFFIADRSITPEYDCGPDFPAEDRCQFKAITPLEAAGILSVLRGGGNRLTMMDEFPLLTPQDDEEWTMAVPDDMTSSLAELDDSRIPDIAQKCADVTAGELVWSADDFQRVLKQLRALARRAIESSRAIYLWMAL